VVSSYERAELIHEPHSWRARVQSERASDTLVISSQSLGELTNAPELIGNTKRKRSGMYYTSQS